MFLCGVAFHHAGMDLSDRKLVESAFSQGDLPVLSQCKFLTVLNFTQFTFLLKDRDIIYFLLNSCSSFYVITDTKLLKQEYFNNQVILGIIPKVRCGNYIIMVHNSMCLSILVNLYSIPVSFIPKTLIAAVLPRLHTF